MIWITSGPLTVLKRKMEHDLQNVVKWCNEFNFNSSICQFVNLQFFTIKISSHPLLQTETSRELQYLHLRKYHQMGKVNKIPWDDLRPAPNMEPTHKRYGNKMQENNHHSPMSLWNKMGCLIRSINLSIRGPNQIKNRLR